MNKQKQIEHTANDLKERANDKVSDFKQRVGKRACHYASNAIDSAHGLIQRGRKATTRRLSAHRGDYAKQITHCLEDAVDELSYHYRRVKRHAKRRPVTTALVVAGTVGTFLLLSRLFRHSHSNEQ